MSRPRINSWTCRNAEAFLSQTENIDELYYPSYFTLKNVRVRYIEKFDKRMEKHDFFIEDIITTRLKFNSNTFNNFNI